MMKKLIGKVCIVSCAVALFITCAAADVRMPSVFGSNMVLQRGMAVPVWGWADTGEEVTVAFNGQSATARADPQGRWKIKLKAMEAGGPFEMTVHGANTLKLTNVLVGEVWVCSGQSNMEMKVLHCNDASEEVAAAFHPHIRLFDIKNNLSPEPLDDCTAEWKICRPSTVGDFSATAYYFGREIMKELDVPVGLIHTSWGGSSVETWMSSGAVKESPEFNRLVNDWQPILKKQTGEIASYYRSMGDWIDDLYYALYVRKPFPPTADISGIWEEVKAMKTESSLDLNMFPSMPSWVYNAMIAPIVPFAIKGAIWYQGETNAGRAYQYRELLPALIGDWRRVWNQGDFPFLYVQLANFMIPDPEPIESAWAELREAQFMTLTVTNTAMAVTIDIGEADDIHPRNKQEVGRRLALGALKIAYGKPVAHSGPLYDSMTVQDGEIRLRFSETGSDLASQGGGPVLGFAIAGEDRKFVWAEARIEGDEVLVYSSDVPEPVAVRYGWANNPVCTLYNREGLPASPFRTDDWQSVTFGNH